jgi:predicted membrane-bound spermidine synthase
VVGVRSDEKAFVYGQASQFCKSANKEVEIVILDRTGPDAPTTSRLPSAARADLLFKCVARPAGTP